MSDEYIYTRRTKLQNSCICSVHLLSLTGTVKYLSSQRSSRNGFESARNSSLPCCTDASGIFIDLLRVVSQLPSHQKPDYHEASSLVYRRVDDDLCRSVYASHKIFGEESPLCFSIHRLDNESNNNVDRPSITTARKKRVMSQAIPFLECPAMLAGSNLAGNAGFDPLGFVQNQEDLFMYREAEIKHARLAMLVGVVIKVAAVNDLFFITRCSHVRNFLSQAAAGWPLSELFDRQIAESLGLPPMLDAGDSVPAMLNDSLNSISPVFWGSCLWSHAFYSPFA